MNSPKELGILMIGYMNEGYPPEKVAELCRKNLENSGLHIKDGFEEEMIRIVNDKITKQKQWEDVNKEVENYYDKHTDSE